MLTLGVEWLPYIYWLTPLFVSVGVVLLSIHRIDPTDFGLVMKRFSWKKLSEDNPVALKDEAGYQADLLMPGLRFKLWPFYKVETHPWPQVPANQIGLVIAQVGNTAPEGAKSVEYKKVFGNFSDLRTFIKEGGQKGVQRHVLPPGTLVPIHPVGFLVLTKERIYGIPVNSERDKRRLQLSDFGLEQKDLDLVRIEPTVDKQTGEKIDMVGIIITQDGQPLPSGAIAGRLGEFADIEKLEGDPGVSDASLILDFGH